MESTVETLEDNKVKLSITIDESELEKYIDDAFSRIAKEVTLPGFRPGKAPRKVLEARVGTQYARQEAFRSALPFFYTEAVQENNVDVIAQPELEVTEGELDGPVSFDATVEIRPKVEITGYGHLKVEVSSLDVTDEDVNDAIDALRSQSAEMVEVDRPIEEKDQVFLNIETHFQDELVSGYTTQDYQYEVGSNSVVPELDENLLGAKKGDKLSFDAAHPDDSQSDKLKMEIEVTKVEEKKLPEVTPEWVKDNSEFETIDELKDEYRKRLIRSKKLQAKMFARNELSDKVARLVEVDDIPKSMIDMSVENRLQDFALRLNSQGMSFDDYLAASGVSQEQYMNDLKETATFDSRLDLALRSIASQENLEVSQQDFESEYKKIAPQVGMTPEQVEKEVEQAGQKQAMSADLLKSKSLDWVLEHADIVDGEGNQIAAEDLEISDEVNE